MAAPLSIYVGSQNKTPDSGTATLLVSSDEMNDIMKIVQAYEDVGILLKTITKTFERKIKEQTYGF